MNYCERIPSKTETVILNGENIKKDTEGLEAVIVSREGTVYIKANAETGNGDAFVIEKGERISLNGCFYLNGENAKASILYCRIV